MAGKNLLLSSILIVLLLSVFAKNAYAVTPPTFPVCSNPQGALIASYDSGTHGVPGNSSTFTGKDSVYSLSGDTLLQCLCVDNGQGIQTNWWKVSSLTADEIAVLVSQGWTQIPDGASWGLDAAPYLAKNINFSCSGGGNNGGPGDGLSDGRSDGRGGAVLGASIGDVLGLASTGNTLFILSVLLTGLIMLSLGAIPNIKRKN